MAQVFISYAHEDGDFGDVLITKLKEEDITHWVDSEHLRAGEDWRQAIDDAIRNSFALIVIMSPAAKASEYVTYEWAFAWGLGVPVIPLLYKQTNLHPRLEALQYLDFSNRNARPWAKLIERIVDLQNQPRIRATSNTPSDIPPYVMEALEMLERANTEEETKKALEFLATSKHPYAREKLISALDDHRVLVRINATRELGDLQETDAIPQLVEMLRDRDQEVRKIAIHALTRTGDTQVLPQIHARLNDYSSEVRGMAATSLGIFRSTESTSVLLKALDDPVDLVRSCAASALGLIMDGRSVSALIKRLGDKSYSVQSSAAEALEQIGTPEAHAAVEEWSTQLDSALPLKYKPGMRVFHSTFGEGVVKDSRRAGKDEEVNVEFDNVGRKLLAASFANLQILKE